MMTTQVIDSTSRDGQARILNRVGYSALREAAQRAPLLFVNAEVDKLEERLIELAGTDDIWDPPLPLAASLSPLNDVALPGPETDAEFTPVLRTALENLPLSRAADERMWASLNTFAIPSYVPRRWSTSRLRETNPRRFVQHHWIDYSRGLECGRATLVASGAGYTSRDPLKARKGRTPRRNEWACESLSSDVV